MNPYQIMAPANFTSKKSRKQTNQGNLPEYFHPPISLFCVPCVLSRLILLFGSGSVGLGSCLLPRTAARPGAKRPDDGQRDQQRQEEGKRHPNKNESHQRQNAQHHKSDTGQDERQQNGHAKHDNRGNNQPPTSTAKGPSRA